MKKIKEIVLIDDDGPTNFLHQVVIKRSKCAEEVKVFDNAGEALSYLLGDGVDKNVLIFLDINMPVMSGWDFIDQFHQSKNKEAVVIMLTSSINPNDEKRAESFASVNAYRSKPLTESMLSEIVQEFYG